MESMTSADEIEFINIKSCSQASYPSCIQQGLHSRALLKLIFSEYPRQPTGCEPPKIMILGIFSPFAMCIRRLSGPIKWEARERVVADFRKDNLPAKWWTPSKYGCLSSPTWIMEKLACRQISWTYLRSLDKGDFRKVDFIIFEWYFKIFIRSSIEVTIIQFLLIKFCKS